MLCHFDAAGWRHKGRGCGNIKAVRAVSAGPYDLHKLHSGIYTDGVFPHGRGAAGDLRYGFRLGAFGGESS